MVLISQLPYRCRGLQIFHQAYCVFALVLVMSKFSMCQFQNMADKVPNSSPHFPYLCTLRSEQTTSHLSNIYPHRWSGYLLREYRNTNCSVIHSSRCYTVANIHVIGPAFIPQRKTEDM